MKKYITLTLLILGIYSFSIAQKTDEIFTIYLVRHSEKEVSKNPSDPPLTPCGEKRSESLKLLFKDINLQAIYSTNYNRTKNTAKPTALAKKLEIQEYNPNQLKEFSEFLIEKKQDVLVVGHSNTTGVLAGLLVDEEIGEFDLSIYNRVYQVVMCNKNGRLHILHTSFSCYD